MAKDGARKGKRGRFKPAKDAQDQLRQIEVAQNASRSGKIKVKIDSIEKSRQRFLNKLREIKDVDDAINQFE